VINGGWGPQPVGAITPAQSRPPLWSLAWFGVGAVLVSIPESLVITGLLVGPPPGMGRLDTHAVASGVTLLVVVFGLSFGVGLRLGVRDGRLGIALAHTRWWTTALVGLCGIGGWAGYGAGSYLGRRQGARLSGTQAPAFDRESGYERVMAAPDPYAQLRTVAAAGYGQPGGHVGWADDGTYLSANPRGGLLVIGPPGSGKTSAVIIPSVLVAPAATVCSSIKGDVMAATAGSRARLGRVWHFDPGGAEHPTPGVTPVRWSPLVGIRGWDDARIITSRLAAPAMRKTGHDGDGDDHFVERARDWVEVLLYAAHLGGHPISSVADWAQQPDAEAVETAVNAELMLAESHGDVGARIALGQHRGLLSIPDRERGSIKSSMAKLLRIYGSVTARRIGENPNFDPRAFVSSHDTLYLTASPERQHEYAPLIAGLLEAIRFAVYERHKAYEAGTEPARPHVTFVLDEANNTAPIPLPAIISEAGGQSLHIIVGIQDLSRARARWGREADGFLTLFPAKLVLTGIVEPYTLDALSAAAGEYDRIMAGYSETTTYLTTGASSTSYGPYGGSSRSHHRAIAQHNPTYSIHRQRVLHQGDIARLPAGKALLFDGAAWSLVNLAMHWNNPLWQRVLASRVVASHQPPAVAWPMPGVPGHPGPGPINLMISTPSSAHRWS
jgi:hypothetical protein